MADYFEYAVITKKGSTIDYFDEYLLKDTSQEDATITQYFPNRIVTKEKDYNNPRIKTYQLSKEEASQLKAHPDLFDVEIVIPDDQLFSTSSRVNITPDVIQDGLHTALIFGVQANSTQYPSFIAPNDYSSPGMYHTASAPINWGLKFHTQYPKMGEVDWEELYQYDSVNNVYLTSSDFTSTTSSLGYPYTLDGTGVDIVIMDGGVKPHPEFFDENGNLRIVQYDWFQHIPNALGITFEQFYDFDNWSTDHGTHVASIAAGKYCGWAKNATLYDARIFGNRKLSSADAFEAIRHFHISKSVDPTTGRKRPTVVNCSWSINVYVIGSTSGEVDGTTTYQYFPPTHITQIYYKGQSLNLTGNDNQPTKAHNIRHNRKYDLTNPTQYSMFFKQYNALQTVLSEQCTDEGIFICKSAGNEQTILVREYDPDQPEKYNEIYNSYITMDQNIEIAGLGAFIPAGDPIYTNRLDLQNPNIILVGSIAPYITMQGPQINDPSHPANGSYTYDIWGYPRDAAYLFNFISLGSPYNHIYPKYWDPNNPRERTTFEEKRGIGSGSAFPGWNALKEEGYLTISPFSNVGPAVDVNAAGSHIAAAIWQDNDTGISYAQNNYIDFRNYDPNYTPDPNISPDLNEVEYMWMKSGTSMSTPQIAGVAALYLQMNPGATSKQFKQFLSQSASTSPRLQLFSEDPENRIDYTGSMFEEDLIRTNTTPVPNGQMFYSDSQTTALNGAPRWVLHWPYSLPNPGSVT